MDIHAPAITSEREPMPPDNGGPKTTEFWTTVVTNLISVAVAGAALFGRQLDPGPLQALVPAVAVLAAALTTALYSRSRAQVKSAQVQAEAQVAAARFASTNIQANSNSGALNRPFASTTALGRS